MYAYFTRALNVPLHCIEYIIGPFPSRYTGYSWGCLWLRPIESLDARNGKYCSILIVVMDLGRNYKSLHYQKQVARSYILYPLCGQLE